MGSSEQMTVRSSGVVRSFGWTESLPGCLAMVCLITSHLFFQLVLSFRGYWVFWVVWLLLTGYLCLLYLWCIYLFTYHTQTCLHIFCWGFLLCHQTCSPAPVSLRDRKRYSLLRAWHTSSWNCPFFDYTD
ncbi:uncharacterized protein BDW47DRAFT_107712 [Aspergillus candidus]|uniref:Uncharacterized protein n=1 Tax=Aspergillus candidus TaxID=41067 RepID=A0A2I2F8S3_ASPCN|nr:hypothetical protein BDW47DRAFT_107712 [Aspergillus candidus]PLB37032.1 hypothetical protein BDW47DRAFT_107712 [Aspergillus candidus]